MLTYMLYIRVYHCYSIGIVYNSMPLGPWSLPASSAALRSSAPPPSSRGGGGAGGWCGTDEARGATPSRQPPQKSPCRTNRGV